LQTYGLQLGEPVEPAGRFVQVPLAVAPSAAEQTSQAPVQAALQQNPSEQLPDAHSALLEQLCPIGLRHCPETQVNGATQSLLSTQVVTHPLPPTQTYGAQSVLCTWQLEPLQIGRRSIEPLQVTAPQLVPLGAGWQAPDPLQLAPSQLATGHSFFGSLPAVALVQAEPVAFTTWQSWEQLRPAGAQRRSFCDCWQLPDWH
jgi:hypothetical protein